MLSKRVRRLAQRLLDELDGAYLEVVLIPDQRYSGYGNNFRRLRAVQTQNVEWYRKFCAGFTKHRTRPRKRKKHHDTSIKRAWTRRGLQALIAGRCETIYAQRLLDFIEREYPMRTYRRITIKPKMKVRKLKHAKKSSNQHRLQHVSA